MSNESKTQTTKTTYIRPNDYKIKTKEIPKLFWRQKSTKIGP